MIKRLVPFLFLMMVPQAPTQAPTRPTYQQPTLDDLKKYYSDCSTDLRKTEDFMRQQELYINKLEAEIAELKKK